MSQDHVDHKRGYELLQRNGIRICNGRLLNDHDDLTVQGEEECEPGQYGDGCSQNCSQNCYPLPNGIVKCHKETGECFEGCKAGVYGDQCDEPCSKTCLGNICNQHNGHCTLGCIENHIGVFCEIYNGITIVHQGTTSSSAGTTSSSAGTTSSSAGTTYSSHTTVTTGVAPTSSSQVIIPVVVTVLVLILILVGAVVIFIWRRKKEKKKKKNLNGDDAEAWQSCLGDKTRYVQKSTITAPDVFVHRPSQDSWNIAGAKPGGIWGSPRDGQDTQDLSRMEATLMKKIQEMQGMVMSSRRPGDPQPSDSSVFSTPTPARRDARTGQDLHSACSEGNLAEVKRILDTGRADVNCRSVGGMTPVMWAALRGHRDVVELLVSRGADVSLVDDDGNNILHWACEGGDRKTVEFVLSLDGVDINSRGWKSITPVMEAAWWGHRDVLAILVIRGADVSLVDDMGNNILHWACMGGDRKTVEFVLSLDGMDINSRGWKRLHRCCGQHGGDTGMW
ncbi:uncharacterized protein LOC124253050 [Haliotis rubra]|uniref:uncharacterized protein LOC124253050 n=1 Tax=Haliotis rubra TaxID=36100 RepID=UPI001EE4ECEA|nr:uncharacterized protein LOC124253050 [Haliotis rubra]